MRLLITKPEIILFALCSLRAVLNAKDWSLYFDCAAPIQIFLVAAPLTLMIMILTFSFFRAYVRVSRIRKYFDALIILVLTPFCFYLIIQGTIWQFIIYSKPVNPLYCPAVNLPTYWIWVLLLSVIEIRFVKVSWIMGKAYWKGCQIRRRIRNLQQSANNGDYERFNEIVLELGEVYNDKIGLLPADIARLEKKYYQPATEQKAEENIENCPICLVEFNADEKVITLPKCEHNFHSECVGAWLQKKPLCPMCRRNVRNGMIDTESQRDEENQYRPPAPEVIENPQ